MSYPGTFPNSPAGYDFGQASYNAGQHPAFEYAGAIYTFVTQDSPSYSIISPVQDSKLHCLKSTDRGQTWVELDAANAQALTGSGVSNQYQYSVAVDGSNAVIFNPQVHAVASVRSVQQINFIKFNLAIGLWGANTTVATGAVDFVYHNSTPGATNGIFATYTRIIVLSPGSYLVFFAGTPDTVAGKWWTRLYYATFDGVTLGSAMALPGQGSSDAFTYLGFDAILDAGGIVHFVYGKMSGAGSIYHVGLNTSGFSFGTEAAISVLPPYWNDQTFPSSAFSNLVLYTPAGGSETLAIVGELDAGATQKLAFIFATTALNPSWSENYITSGIDVTSGHSGTSTIDLFPIPNTAGGGVTPCVGLSEKNGTLAVVWNHQEPSTESGSVIYSLSPSDVLSWDAPATLWTIPTITGSDFTQSGPTQLCVFKAAHFIGILASAINLDGNGAEVTQFNILLEDSNIEAWLVINGPRNSPITTSVTIPAKTLPWISGGGLNSSFNYNQTGGMAPVVISGLIEGDTVSIEYQSGLCSIGGGNPAQDCDGSGLGTESAPTASGFYIVPCFVNGLIGAFTDSAGSIVQLVNVGNSAALIVPAGATQLQFGMDDGDFHDNTGSWIVSATITAVTALADQTRRMDGQSSQSGSFQQMLRQRGTATIPLRVQAGDTYAPTMGSQVFLYDQNSDGFTRVFSGTIDDIEEGWDGTSGARIYTLQCVSFEQCFDVQRITRPQSFLNKTAAFIINALFDEFMTGAPVSLGTISTGATVTSLVIQDFPSFASILDKLATLSGFVWYVDPVTATLQFHLPDTTPAPYDLITSQVQWESMKWKQTRQDFRDRQILQISPDAFTHSAELFQGNSSAQTFTMLRPISQVTNAWTTKNTQNTATGTFTGQPNAGDTIGTVFPSSGSGFNWAATSPYIVGQIIVNSAGHVQRCTVAGTSGGSEPTWNNTGGATGPDGTVFWQDDGISGGGGLGGATYTFVDELDNTVFGEVLKGATFTDSTQNLVDAINRKESAAGITFSLPTWENPLVNADSPSGGVFVIRNKNAGQGYIASLTESCTNFTWSAPQTSGGVTTFGTYVLQVAVEGTSNTANLYYTPGSDSVKLASVPSGGPSLPLSAGQYLQVEYTRLGGDCIQVEDSALVAERAAIEDGTGRYQQFTSDTSQTSNTAGLLEAQQALAAYSTIPESFVFDTLVPGLTPGQWLTFTLLDLPVGIAALINDQGWVVQEVSGSFIADVGSYLDTDHPYLDSPSAPGAGHYRYTITVINASVIGSYLDFWEGLASGGSGGSSGGATGGGGSPAGLAGYPNGVHVKTASYTATATDNGTLITVEDVSPHTAVTLTLPATPPSQTWQVEFQNASSFAVTISRNGLSIDGLASNVTLTAGSGIEIRTDGANYFTQRGDVSAGTSINFSDNEAPSGTINGSNAAFTLAHTPSPTASLQLFMNGVLQIVGTDYTLATATITMTAAPTTGANLRAWYRY